MFEQVLSEDVTHINFNGFFVVSYTYHACIFGKFLGYIEN